MLLEDPVRRSRCEPERQSSVVLEVLLPLTLLLEKVLQVRDNGLLVQEEAKVFLHNARSASDGYRS